MYVDFTRVMAYIVGEEEYSKRMQDFDIVKLFTDMQKVSNYQFDKIDSLCKIGVLYISIGNLSEEFNGDLYKLLEAEQLLCNIFIGKRCMELGIKYDENYFEQLTEKELGEELKILKKYLPSSKGFRLWKIGWIEKPSQLIIKRAKETMTKRYNNDYGEL